MSLQTGSSEAACGDIFNALRISEGETLGIGAVKSLTRRRCGRQPTSNPGVNYDGFYKIGILTIAPLSRDTQKS